MRGNNGAIKAINKAVLKKDYETVKAKAKEIMGSMDKLPDLFPKGSLSEKSRAHPDIWEKWIQFGKRAANVKKEAAALSKAAAAKDADQIQVQAKALGNNREGACGECHRIFRTDFRKEKKE